MKTLLGATVVGCVVLTGCAMIGGWRSIPPPGGCDRCHTVAINADWRATITAAQLSREDGTPPWQQEGAVLPTPPSPVEQQLLQDERCFRCHREPDGSHQGYRGRYHHRMK